MQAIQVRFVAGLIEIAKQDARNVPSVSDPDNNKVVLISPENFNKYLENKMKEVPDAR